ncbi:MAG: tetratricopeptide repeat protein [Desulfurivibrionaceae bacterium]|jgi:Tfp pilus assembly protein PilF
MRATLLLLLVVLLALAGCAGHQQSKQGEATSPIQKNVEEGIALLAKGDAKQANAQFNRALALAPSDPNLHFLNGLAYREMARVNGQAVAELAETGYRLALEFDSNHWLAAWHLGLLQVEQRQYAEARKSLATAARLRPRNPDIQLALAGSAYQASDAPVALWAANNTLSLRPNDPEALRIAALSSAALGLESSALELRDRFRQVRPADAEILDDRISAWKKTSAQADTANNGTDTLTESIPGSPAPTSAAETGTPPTQSTSGNPAPPIQIPGPWGTSGGTTSNPGGSLAEEGPLARSWSECSQSPSSQSGSSLGGVNNSSNWGGGNSNSWGGGNGSDYGRTITSDTTERLPALPSPCKGIPLPRMVVVDVTLIRTQEITEYNQGVNLLDGLKIVLGGSWERTSESTKSDRDPSGNTIRSTNIARSLGLPQGGITYSLNIFNAGDTSADVIARPSLLALDRTPSTFFSGSTLSVAITGQYGGSITDKNIGVSLSVTPTFIDDDRLLLSVKGARSFIEPTQFEGFDEVVSSTNNTVSTNVIMRFGETLILSGLRERENVKTKNGAPLLRDVPVLQYLFSTHSDYDYAQHILILITPRKPATSSETDRAAHAYAHTPEFQVEPDDAVSAEALGALRSRRPNLEAIVAKLQRSKYRHEFRSGDLSSRRFAPSPSLERVIQDIKQMMYF